MIYDLLFKASAQAMLIVAADPKHLGARLGITAVLHTWGSAMTHHPHVHMIVPSSGLSADQSRWISSRPRFLLSVRVLSRLFRRLFLQMLLPAHATGSLRFFADYRALADGPAFGDYLEPLRKAEWVVYAKEPFGGPEAVLAYLSRYSHRVAIANSRLIAADDDGVTFTWKDYRFEGRDRHKAMTLATPEFIRRSLIHVLPKGFHRIRRYGLFANGQRAANLARARELLHVAPPATASQTVETATDAGETRAEPHPCPCCGGCMLVIEVFARGCAPKYRPQRAPPLGSRTIS